MATTFLVENDFGIYTDVISFDVTKTETHENAAFITEFPVESGSNISDHIRPLPKAFSCEVFVSNTPVKPYVIKLVGVLPAPVPRGTYGMTPLQLPQPFSPQLLFKGPWIATPGAGTRTLMATAEGRLVPPVQVATTLKFDLPFDAVVETHAKLMSVLESHQKVRVVTSRTEYDNMYLVRVGMPVTLGDGTGASFHIEARQVKKVTPGSVEAPKVPAEPNGQPKKSRGGQGAKTVDEANHAGEVTARKAADGLLATWIFH